MLNIQEILQLSAAERLLLMEEIWDSIDAEEIEISESQKEEVQRRIARHQKGETKYVSWESIKKDLRTRK